MNLKGNAHVAIIIIVALVLIFVIQKSRPVIPSSISMAKTASGKLKGCPDRWQRSTNGEVFFVDGVKSDVNSFDISWIKNNCLITQPRILP